MSAPRARSSPSIRMQPLDETSVSSDHPAKYAIELNQGMAAKTGVKVGDKLAIPAGLRAR